MLYDDIGRDKLRAELSFELKEANMGIAQEKAELQTTIDRLMDMVDSYAQHRNSITPIKAMTMAETAIFNFYRTYFMFPLASYWDVRIKNITLESAMFLEAKTDRFYCSNYPLAITMRTFNREPSLVEIYNTDELLRQAKSNDVSEERFQIIVEAFDLDTFKGCVYFKGHADELEAKAFKMLELARFIQEKHTDIPTADYLKSTHIMKAFERTDNGDVRQNVY